VAFTRVRAININISDNSCIIYYNTEIFIEFMACIKMKTRVGRCIGKYNNFPDAFSMNLQISSLIHCRNNHIVAKLIKYMFYFHARNSLSLYFITYLPYPGSME